MDARSACLRLRERGANATTLAIGARDLLLHTGEAGRAIIGEAYQGYDAVMPSEGEAAALAGLASDDRTEVLHDGLSSEQQHFLGEQLRADAAREWTLMPEEWRHE